MGLVVPVLVDRVARAVVTRRLDLVRVGRVVRVLVGLAVPVLVHRVARAVVTRRLDLVLGARVPVDLAVPDLVDLAAQWSRWSRWRSWAGRSWWPR